MGVVFGSARVDENGKATGGKAGDQTGKEVSTQAYYKSPKGWWCLRPKDPNHAKKMATAMKNACTNDNWGYDQTNRAAIKMIKKYGSTKAVAEKTETDCSNLVRGCIYEATGIDVGEFYTGNEASVLEKSGLFEDRFNVSSSSELMTGDVLVTKTKGHTVIVVSGKTRTTIETTTDTTTKEETSSDNKPSYNKTVKFEGIVTAYSLNVRKGPGKEYANITSYPTIKSNTRVGVCDETKDKNGDAWYYVNISGKYGFVSAKYIKKA